MALFRFVEEVIKANASVLDKTVVTRKQIENWTTGSTFGLGSNEWGERWFELRGTHLGLTQLVTNIRSE